MERLWNAVEISCQKSDISVPKIVDKLKTVCYNKAIKEFNRFYEN